MKRVERSTVFALLMFLAMLGYTLQPTRASSQEPQKPTDVQPQEEKQEKQQPDAKESKEEKKSEKKSEKQAEKQNEKQDSAQPASGQSNQVQGEHNMPAQQSQAHPAGKGARIPDDKFKASFGKPHKFTINRVITTTTIVPNQTQFVYGGYTFIFLDPWPAGWVLTDDCYIDYSDGEYFLFDLAHPGVGIALTVVL
jgi:flagellum-specific peptidoglycan hydrolase FlgJ